MIKIITILVGIVLLAIRFWPKTKTSSPTTTSATPAASTTKKFSWGWIIFLGIIIIGGLFIWGGMSSKDTRVNQIISYTPSIVPTEIPLGKGMWKFQIVGDEKYIIPGMRVATATGKELPISPLGEGKSYYGGVLVNMSPNNSTINSDGRVVVTLRLPAGIKMVKGNAVMLSFEPQ